MMQRSIACSRFTGSVIALGLLAAGLDCAAQAPVAAVAAPKMQFEVASVRPNKTSEKSFSNFPLGPQSQYNDTGGQFVAVNKQLLEYVVFAYLKTITQVIDMRAQMPEWTHGIRYDIRAQAAVRNPTKDEMRAMMQSLLEDRFAMKVHHEMRQVPVYALVLAKPGKLGPKLEVHPADDPDCVKKALPQSLAGGYPATCGTGVQIAPSAAGLTAVAAHGITMQMIAVGLGGASTDVERPVIDRTGLSGTFDYTLEWAPGNPSAAADPEGAEEMAGPSFLQALRDQLGLKLVPQMGPMDFVVLDHIERPSEN
jgi:uncharacterized protein (TIGR03435 family)